MTQRAEDPISAQTFGTEAENVLSAVRTNSTGFLAVWVEDEAGQVLASSGPENLVAGYVRLRQPRTCRKMGWSFRRDV